MKLPANAGSFSFSFNDLVKKIDTIRGLRSTGATRAD
jgi:hypothetical protein